MVRLNQTLKESMITKIKQDISINKISNSLGLGKSTIYYYYKKINGKKYKKPVFNIQYSETEGEILGIFIGDGSQHYSKSNCNYQTSIHFGNRLEYIYLVKGLFERYFNKKWPLYKEITKEGRIKYRLRVVDKTIFDYFPNYIDYDKHSKHNTVKLRTILLPTPFKIGLLRGLVDTDGTVCKCKDGRIRIQYYTTSEVLAEQIKGLLQEFNITCFISKSIRYKLKDIYQVGVYKKDVVRFIKQIQPYKAINMGW